MRVSQLIELLASCDPNADVFVMSQSHYPFECRMAGVAVRGDWLEEEDEGEEGDQAAEAGPARAHRDRWTAADKQLPRTDVFLLEGVQLRYGAKEAWDNAR